MSDEERYETVRFYLRDGLEPEVVKRDLTLQEARERCSDPETSSRTTTDSAGLQRTATYGPWFEGYRRQA